MENLLKMETKKDYILVDPVLMSSRIINVITGMILKGYIHPVIGPIITPALVLAVVSSTHPEELMFIPKTDEEMSPNKMSKECSVAISDYINSLMDTAIEVYIEKKQV